MCECFRNIFGAIEICSGVIEIFWVAEDLKEIFVVDSIELLET